jgi:short-subunit dehydrogenase
MFRLENKIAWITGAASGLGKELSIGLAKKGMRLVLIDKDSAGLDEMVSILEPGNYIRLCVDISSPSDLENQLERIDAGFKNIDVLINCAGITSIGFIDDTSLEAFKQIVDVNFYSALVLIKKVLPIMKKKQSGQIVNISSAMGRRSTPITTPYCTSKAALTSLTEGLRVEVEDDNINVMLVYPGPMRTNMMFSYELYSTELYPAMEEYKRKLKPPSPQKMASKIIRGIEKQSRQVKKFTPVEFFLLINFFFPAVADKIMKFIYLRKLIKRD